jgi:nucleolar protein 53
VLEFTCSLLFFDQLPPSFVQEKKKAKSTTLDLPKPGQSYNPAAEDHEMLLNSAIEDLQKEEEQRRKEIEWKKAWDEGAKEARGKGEDGFEDLVGLKVGRGDANEIEEEDDFDDDESDQEVKEIKRKTKQQKAKAKKIKEEIRARSQAKETKRSMSELQSIKSFKKQLLATETKIKEMAEKRRLAKERKMQDRVGVYKLPKMQEEVQLGEDLAEGLRTLKVITVECR